MKCVIQIRFVEEWDNWKPQTGSPATRIEMGGFFAPQEGGGVPKEKARVGQESQDSLPSDNPLTPNAKRNLNPRNTILNPTLLQGYLSHKKTPTPLWPPLLTLGIGLR